MSFLASLSFEDLQLLRSVVRRVHMKHYPVELVTDRECDRVIEAQGPETMARVLDKRIRRFVQGQRFLEMATPAGEGTRPAAQKRLDRAAARKLRAMSRDWRQ